MKRLRVCAAAALGSFASFVAAAPLEGDPMSRPIVALALALFALAPAAIRPAAAQSTQDTPMVRIGTLGGVFSTLWAVNNDNAAVGWSDVTYTDSEHAILWQDGQLIDLGTLPGDTVSRASGINDLGQVVGLSVNTDGLSRLVRPVLWQQGQAIELPGGEGCTATAINNKGHIALWCGGPSVLRDGQRVAIGTLPGYSGGYVYAINDAASPSGRCSTAAADPRHSAGRTASSPTWAHSPAVSGATRRRSTPAARSPATFGPLPRRAPRSRSSGSGIP
jgi:probable HAF family extracellular repeat protein